MFLLRLIRNTYTVRKLLNDFIWADDWQSVAERDAQGAHVLEAIYDVTHGIR